MTATTRVVVPRQRLVPWASGVLNLPADASDAQRRARLYAAVREADFIPSPEIEQAIAVLGQSSQALTLNDSGWSALAEAERDEAQRDIEAFAARFFDLAPSPRREQWLALRTRYGYLVAWRRRLASLEPGLVVVAPSSTDRHVQRLVGQIRATYALPPAERTSRDVTFLREALDHPSRWRSAAVQLLKRHSAVAQLASHLVQELIARSPYDRGSARVLRGVGAVVGSIVSVFGVFRSGYVWILVILLINGLRACSEFDRPTRIPRHTQQQIQRNMDDLKFMFAPPPGAKKLENSDLPALYGLEVSYDVYIHQDKIVLVKKPPDH